MDTQQHGAGAGVISVIMPTRNRAPILPAAVTALDAAAKGHDVEIIIIDNGSSDGTAAMVASLATSNAAVVYATEPVAGVCRAKNRGIRLARGDILVFTDDDCRVAPDYFAVLAAHYRHQSGPVVVGGRVELGDPTDAPITIKTEDAFATLGGVQHPGGFVHGCNLTMTRSVLDRVGMWDERFGPGAPFKAAEETELNYRAHKAGIPVHYLPSLVSQHFHGRKGLSDVKDLNRSYQFGNGALFGKHPDMLLARHLYWNTRNWISEWFGGPIFDRDLGLSHGDLVRGQLAGTAAYWKSAVLPPSRRAS